MSYELAQKLTDHALKNASKVYDTIRGSYNVFPPEIVIYCPENIQKYSIVFEAKGGFLPKKIKFPYGAARRIKLRPLRGLTDLSDAVVRTTDGFELKTKSMESEDTFILDLEYDIQDPNYITSLVERHHAKEIPSTDSHEYWMHAELKHPKVLKTKYGKLELQDIDFNVDVGISGDINTVIPDAFKKELQIGVEILKETDPHRFHQLGVEKIQAMRSRGKKKTAVEALGALQEVFIPQSFCKYIDVEKDFHYSDCLRGNKCHDTVPWNLTWPKTMKVISRTDLNLDNFAAEGIVKYNRRNFVDEVGKIVGYKK
ncbi:hypothetical protein [Methanococcoides sp. AM1]|uniref:hypothetical protein n=1 Tax=Methanococcoides sp. AM1 TaxID=1201011 RepID=UPI001083D6E9|nr:hypothetical protein [Methanococcoides sp. AM1]